MATDDYWTTREIARGTALGIRGAWRAARGRDTDRIDGRIDRLHEEREQRIADEREARRREETAKRQARINERAAKVKAREERRKAEIKARNEERIRRDAERRARK